jgi:hypothetical protein
MQSTEVSLGVETGPLPYTIKFTVTLEVHDIDPVRAQSQARRALEDALAHFRDVQLISIGRSPEVLPMSASQLIQSWIENGDEQEQRETLEAIQQGLHER